MKIREAAYDQSGDESSYTLTRYGAALLNSNEVEKRRKGASYLVDAAKDDDIQSIRLLEALDATIVDNIGDKSKAIDLIVKAPHEICGGKKLITLE